MIYLPSCGIKDCTNKPMKKKQKKIVAVAMSGGVDSSVAAYLLQQQGYEVVGVMAKFWGDAAFREGGFQDTCCSIETRKKGEAVAAKLGIPFYFLDFEVPFKEHVVDAFVAGYKNGITPNPCVLCNREVKIGMLLKKVREMFGVDYLATGHYAQIVRKGSNVTIKRSKDTYKDQTYFISRVRKEDLAHLMFPCGGYTKDQIRAIAKEAGLAPLVLAESQELCFFSEKTPGAYLQKNIGKVPGDVVDVAGKKLGTHHGAYKFTIGQRKGLDLKMEKAVYVSEIDTKNNKVVVTYQHDDKKLQNTSVVVKKFNMLQKVTKGQKVLTKLRHTPEFSKAVVSKIHNDSLEITLDSPQRAVMPGQIAALYANQTLLGGGEIVSAR